MDILGVTPVESAFEIIGLVNCKLVMDYIVSTKLLAIAFCIGCFYSLWEWAQKGKVESFAKFFVLFFSIWFLFVLPIKDVPKVSSTMEQGKYFDNQTTDEIANDKISGKKVNTLLLFMSKFFNSINIGLCNVLSVGISNPDFNYLNNPFIINKTSVQMQKFIGNGIQDEKLREDVWNFYHIYYSEALTELSRDNANSDDSAKWWPGHPDVVKLYEKKGKAGKEWTVLKGRLKDYLLENDDYQLLWTSVKRMIWLKGFEKLSVSDKEIISLLSSEKHFMNSNKGVDNNQLSWWEKTIQRFNNVGADLFISVGSALMQFFSYTAAKGMIKILPYVEGIAILIMYTFFPITLLLAILYRNYVLILSFFKYMFWVKSWVVIWCLINNISIMMAQLQSKVSPGVSWVWERPYFNIATSIFLIMTPMIAYFFVEGVVQGIGQVSTAATLHIDKATGLGSGAMSGGIKSAKKVF